MACKLDINYNKDSKNYSAVFFTETEHVFCLVTDEDTKIVETMIEDINKADCFTNEMKTHYTKVLLAFKEIMAR
ncbi:MAG: hypothetical protein PHQ86_09300 [Dehalococcoidales bacterium]|nr:hypothetical protein [Dehalococcoidales bacterium]